jgi:hypothetical protein
LKRFPEEEDLAIKEFAQVYPFSIEQVKEIFVRDRYSKSLNNFLEVLKKRSKDENYL